MASRQGLQSAALEEPRPDTSALLDEGILDSSSLVAIIQSARTLRDYTVGSPTFDFGKSKVGDEDIVRSPWRHGMEVILHQQ